MKYYSKPGISQTLPKSFYFSEIIGKKVILNGKKIGRLLDLVIVETHKCPEVTHFYIGRPFGNPSLMVPWENVQSISSRSIKISIDRISHFEGEPTEGTLKLKDYVLDKKVIDLEDHEVEVVYDLRLIINKFDKLLLFEVDISRIGLLRRLGMSRLAKFLQGAGKQVDDLSIPWMYVQPLPSTISRFKGDVKLKILKENLSKMHPVDLADIIEDMDQDQRVMIFSELDTSTASDTLEEIDPPIQREMVSALSREKSVALINEMTPGQAADILSALPVSDAQDIIEIMAPEKASKVSSILDKSEENILNYTTTKFILLPPDIRVGQVQDDYPRLAKGKDVIMYLYIVDDSDVLRGVVDIKELLQADDNANLIDIMVYDMITLTSESTLKEAADQFTRYDFRALPVVDGDEKIIGVVPYRDVMNLRHHFID